MIERLPIAQEKHILRLGRNIDPLVRVNPEVQPYFSYLIVVFSFRCQINYLTHNIVICREDGLQTVHEELMPPLVVVLLDEALFKREINGTPIDLGLLIDDYLTGEPVVRHCQGEWITQSEDKLQSRALL